MRLKFDHVTLSVSDMERSIAFYQDLLGFKKVDIIECPPEGRLGDVVGIRGCSARLAHLRLGDMILELFEYKAPRGKSISQERTQADIGLTHLGFASENIHSDYEKLRKLGVKFYSEPIEYRPGVWNAYFYGPDGETCEIRQVTTNKKSEFK